MAIAIPAGTGTVEPGTTGRPCQEWIVSSDIPGARVSGIDPAVVNLAVEAAVGWLFTRTLGRYPGRCVGTFRPAQTSSPESAASITRTWDHSFADDYGVYGELPTLGGRGLSRWPEPQADMRAVRLPADNVREVLLVVIDGQVIAQSAYRLSDRCWLLRVDGGSWPCPDPNDPPGTFDVSISWGDDPPAHGILAATELAVELAKAFSGQAGCLYSGGRVTDVARQGVTVTLADATRIMDARATMIPAVDLWLAVENPGGLTHLPQLSIPGVAGPRRIPLASPIITLPAAAGCVFGVDPTGPYLECP